MPSLEELLREGRYLEFLEAVARDEVLRRVLGGRRDVIDTLVFLAAWGKPGEVKRIAGLAEKLGSDPSLAYLASALRTGRLEELAKLPGLRRYGLVAAGAVPPSEALRVVGELAKRSRLVAQVLAAKYILNALRRGVNPRELAEVAEAAGLEEVARVLKVGTEEAKRAVIEAIREQLPRLLEKGLVRIPGLDEARGLIARLERLAEEARRVAREAEESGAPEAYARAARRLLKLYEEARRLAERLEKLGFKVDVSSLAESALGAALGAILAGVVRGGLEGYKRMLAEVRPVLERLAPGSLQRLEEVAGLTARMGVGTALQVIKCLFPEYKPVVVAGAGRPGRLQVV